MAPIIEEEYREPALRTFLAVIRKDIAAGRNMRDLPAGLARALRRAAKEVPVDLDEQLEGDVASDG
ncbi:MAG TPA: hypothetical protein VEM36_14435 [Xanthobacteraceae bacterium]|nr:hypothetical protein [Xanthobacteraceae bacterium]